LSKMSSFDHWSESWDNDQMKHLHVKRTAGNKTKK
jgi:hypothetical protein